MSSICMYVPSASGGHARYARELMTALATHPRAAHLYELFSSQDLENEYHSDLYPVHAHLRPLRHRSEFRSSASWFASRATHYLRREMEFLSWLKSRPDIDAVHFQEWTPWLAAPMVRRIKSMGKKVYFTVHNVVPHKYPRLIPKFVMHSWTRKACLSCDGIFVHTDDLARRMVEILGEPHPPIHVVPHGVWTVTDAGTGVALEERLSWKKLLFFGAIRRNKGLDLLLDAMPSLPGYSVTIAGDPGEPDYLQDEILPRIERLRAAGAQIDLRLGFTPEEELGGLFQSHSAVVLPYTSKFVAQSGVVFLALAYEVPVVASVAGGLRDLFTQHKIGVTFDDATPSGLSSAVGRLYSSVQPNMLLDEIRAAKQRFSWHDAAGVAIAAYGNPKERRATQYDCSLATTLAH
jgi:glycosyltransferase involved in cell wall biosynthesis